MTIDPKMPPLPRDHAAPTMSEIVPFRSQHISLRKSGLLAPGLATVLMCVYLFSIGGTTQIAQIRGFGTAVGAYLLFMVFWVAYFYSGSRRLIWAFILPFALTLFVGETPIFSLVAFPFRKILPGDVFGLPPNPGFVALFTAHFFGAGLAEELFKALPILLGVGLAIHVDRKGAAGHNRILDFFSVRTPLDGLLFGLASGAAFTFGETVFQYYPDQIKRVSGALKNDAAGLLFGLQLLIPRMLHSLAGHMGWSALVGYFIGLAFVRRSHLIPLLVGGWVFASVIHGLWNASSAVGRPFQYAVAVLGFAAFLACLLKARQMEPRFTGQAQQSGGSIIVTTPPAPVAPHPPTPAPAPIIPVPAAPSVAAPPPGALPAMVAKVAKLGKARKRAPKAAAPPAATPAQPAASSPAAVTQPAGALPGAPPVSSAAFALVIDGRSLPLPSGAQLDLGALPEFTGRGAGILAEVTTHPADPTILGLKNLGQTAWTATASDGASQEVPPQRNVRLAPGTRIAFGALTGEVRPGSA